MSPASQNYDAFNHLWRSLGLSRRSLVAMMTGYFDVSRGNDPIYTMAGYVGRVENWEVFKNKWKALLESEGIKIFNAASLESQKGEYYGWSNHRKISFQQRAFKIITDAREVAIGHSVSINDFKRINLKWVKAPHAETKSHYYHCGVSLMRNVRWWIEKHRIEEPIEYIFEFGDEGWGDFLSLLEEINSDPKEREVYRMNGYSRKFKKDVIQLQAAGTWAYESYKFWANTEIEGQKRERRGSLRPLVRGDIDSAFNTYDNGAALDAMLKQYVAMGGLATRGGRILKPD